MPIKAEIIADSFNPVGSRLTTFVLEYPRMVHAELMTHRVFSKNAASSRAIPIEKMIEQVMTNPAMPEFWGKNQSGMQAAVELSNEELPLVKDTWLQARNSAVQYVQKLNQIGLHKQIANRILEPWFHIKIILSGTEFENWFALRVHQDAQPEIRALAAKMLELYNASEPKYLKEGEWHIPFGDKIDENRIIDDGLVGSAHDYKDEDIDNAKRKIAIARCARISYLNFEGKDDYIADIKLCERLFSNTPKHLSPTEHVAQTQNNSDWSGNFGVQQFRKFFKDENLSDTRVIKKFKKV